MKQFRVAPVIYELDTFSEFADAFSLNKKTLIFTSRHEYEHSIRVSAEKYSMQVMFREDYGRGEPDDITVNKILADFNKLECERIVAVGGGSILDISKVLAVADGETDVNELYGRMSTLKKKCELILIPTTCGTGSEVTNIAVVNRTALGTKQGLVSDEMYADAAIIITEMMSGIPYEVFAASSIDALIHAAESYLSPLCTPYSEQFSVLAIREILLGYKEVAKTHQLTDELGKRFLRAADIAGIAFANGGCGPVHAMSFAFGGKYHVPHGEACYQFFIPVFDFYERTNPDGKIGQFTKLCAECLECEDGMEGLKKILEAILPAKAMHEYGAVPEDVEAFAQSTVDNQQRLLARTNAPMGLEDIRELYKGCL